MRVLVLGGYGFFGRRLLERLLRLPGLEVVVAGRSVRKGEALLRTLQPPEGSLLTSVALDIAADGLAQAVAATRPHLVVHTAGPFQGQSYRVARACIAAGVHYVDIADGRAFVEGIEELDAAARAAGVAVLSGASSVPSLSGAVADQLAQGLACVHEIDIGISPGNRTERGLSTVQAVLGYCGRRIRAQGEEVHGWCGTWSHAYPQPVGRRLLSPCDVPDVTLLPSRYPGQPKVRFGAGLELRFLHRGMNAMAWVARRGWIRDWSAHAAALKRASEWFRGWGSDAGAMHVRVRGEAAGGRPVVREWSLVATDGDGPSVPVLAAAALVQRLRDGGGLEPGARPCIGVLTAAEILAQAQGLAIRTSGFAGAEGLFPAAMGEAYQRLHPEVRRFHDLQGTVELCGEVETEPPAGLAARCLAALLGAPRSATTGPLRFHLQCRDGVQVWTRHFPQRSMRSSLRLRGARLVESLGPTRLEMELREQDGALEMVVRSMRVLGIPCPSCLLPRIEASEHGSAGRLHFHVRASLPLVGRVTGYRGWLQLPARAEAP
jgi:hypothetical protein